LVFELSIVLGVSSHVQKYCAFHKIQKLFMKSAKHIFKCDEDWKILSFEENNEES